jgi:hypothetical protein
MDSLIDIYWILLVLPKLNFRNRYFIGSVEVEYNYVYFFNYRCLDHFTCVILNDFINFKINNYINF